MVSRRSSPGEPPNIPIIKKKKKKKKKVACSHTLYTNANSFKYIWSESKYFLKMRLLTIFFKKASETTVPPFSPLSFISSVVETACEK
jgi:hypothetical protein